MEGANLRSSVENNRDCHITMPHCCFVCCGIILQLPLIPDLKGTSEVRGLERCGSTVRVVTELKRSMPRENTRTSNKLLASRTGAFCAFLRIAQIVFASSKEAKNKLLSRATPRVTFHEIPDY